MHVEVVLWLVILIGEHERQLVTLEIVRIISGSDSDIQNFQE